MAKKWSIDFAGVLATTDEVVRKNVFVNKQGALQFYLKIISVPPQNFPYQEVKTVTCFAEEIDYIDDNMYNDPEIREQEFTEFLNKFIFFFNIEVRTNGAIESYYRAKNVTYLKKNEEFIRSEELNLIPIFTGNVELDDSDTFEEKLINNRFIGDNKNISTDEDDTPSLICWREPESNKLILYGIMDSHDHAYGGFRFRNYSSNYSKMIFSEESYSNHYEVRNIIYLPSKVFRKLEDDLKNTGQPIEINKQVDTNNPTEDEVTPSHIKEEQFIHRFEQRCKALDLYYDRKDLYNFHTAMKTGNLVILAGMSGTGKSKLVQCYADALSLKKEQLLFIPVRPYWQDDADVIGYLDTINNVYRPGDSGLVNLLDHALKNNDQMHIVCFDEMNIARVEHYFSQFLSVLEMDENKRVLRLYNDELESRVYNSNIYSPTIKILNNVLFVGTVNLDETTYQFSDKVLDRANVISLNMIPFHEKLSFEQIYKGEQKNNNLEKEPLNLNAIDYNLFRNKEKVGLLDVEAKCLWEIHLILNTTNRNLGIGWRIAKQVGIYLNNLPKNSELTREEAFDLQIIQRVITKIRGSEEQFKTVIGEFDSETEEVIDSELLNIINDLPKTYKMEKTRQLILEKSKEFKLYGYTI